MHLLYAEASASAAASKNSNNTNSNNNNTNSSNNNNTTGTTISSGNNLNNIQRARTPERSMRPPPPPSPSASSSSSSHNNLYPPPPPNLPHLNHKQVSFQNALRDIPVPQILRDGIPVLRVYANGKTTKTTLRLSSDNFTIYVKQHPSQKSNVKQRWSLSSSKHKSESAEAADRVIDVGAISKIQRGHARRRFELARSRTDNSMRSIMSNISLDTSAATTTEVLDPSLCFSINFWGDWTLDLMILMSSSSTTTTTTTKSTKTTNNKNMTTIRDEILNALDTIIKTYQKAKIMVSNDVLLLRYVWREADKDTTGTAGANELQKILKRINYQIPSSKKFNDSYDKFGKMIHLDRKMRKQGLNFEQTASFLHKLKRDSWIAKPVTTYWNRLFGELMKNGKPRKDVSAKTFLTKFFHGQQGETSVTMDHVKRLFVHLNSLQVPRSGDSSEVPADPTARIDKDRFEAYLNSHDNDAFDPNREIYQEQSMNRPISEYWINSSHNTYLTGDQITSASSVDMYSHALYRGCRCLELDIWDGDVVDNVPRPVVWHGRTMTSKILFKDIIRTIKLFLNFHPDTFPLILSFENHCTLRFQEVMAEQMVRILGNSLYVPTEESLSQGKLPSPMDLRGMVIIKGRRPTELDLDDAEDYEDDVSDDGAPSTVYGSDFGDSDLAKAAAAASKKKVQYKISPSLARLTLFHGNKLKSWESSILNPTHYMHSFSENKVRSLARKTDRRTWTVYNETHMSRTYPAGSRVDSSNYLPILPWSLGCQLVALNFQTNDAALKLNDGRFRENGNCGYVLKPDSLLEMHDKEESKELQSLRVSIRVLSGACIPKPNEEKNGEIIDPYVRVSVFDVKNGDKAGFQSFDTVVCYNNGFNPIFNSEKFSFRVDNTAVAMLQLAIYDKASTPTVSDVFVASASIPISCLRKGLRSVKLFDTTNTRSGAIDFASLLIEVKLSKGSKKGDKDDLIAMEHSRSRKVAMAEF